MSNNRNRSDSQLPSHMAASNPSSATLGRGADVSTADPRGPRVPMDAGGFKLAVPPGTCPAGKVCHWFTDAEKGRIQAAKAAYWEPVSDENGNNWQVASGDAHLHLMAIDKIYYDEDEELRMKVYRDSMGARDAAPLDDGVQSYTPSGAENKIRVNSDPFA